MLVGLLLATAVLLALWPAVRRRVYPPEWARWRRYTETGKDDQFLKRLARYLGEEGTDDLCRQAGRPAGMTGLGLLTLQTVSALGAATLVGMGGDPPMGAVLGICVWFAIRAWVRTLALQRQAQLEMELASFVDLWALLIQSGAGPEEGLHLICRLHSQWLLSAEVKAALEQVAASGLLGESLIAMARRTGAPELIAMMDQVQRILDAGTGLARELSAAAQRVRDKQALELSRSTATASVVGLLPKVLSVFLSLAPLVVATVLSAVSKL